MSEALVAIGGIAVASKVVSGSRTLTWVLGVALGIVPMAPPEHIHEAEEEGHHHVVIHRHSQPHRPGHAGGQPSSIEDHDDEPILTLAVVYTTTARVVPTNPAQVVVARVEQPVVECSGWVADDVEILIHGPPPPPTSLRGPPSSLAL